MYFLWLSLSLPGPDAPPGEASLLLWSWGSDFCCWCELRDGQIVRPAILWQGNSNFQGFLFYSCMFIESCECRSVVDGCLQSNLSCWLVYRVLLLPSSYSTTVRVSGQDSSSATMGSSSLSQPMGVLSASSTPSRELWCIPLGCEFIHIYRHLKSRRTLLDTLDIDLTPTASCTRRKCLLVNGYCHAIQERWPAYIYRSSPLSCRATTTAKLWRWRPPSLLILSSLWLVSPHRLGRWGDRLYVL